MNISFKYVSLYSEKRGNFLLNFYSLVRPQNDSGALIVHGVLELTLAKDVWEDRNRNRYTVKITL